MLLPSLNDLKPQVANMTMERNENIRDHRQLTDWSVVANESNYTEHLPLDMRFNDGHLVSIIVYSILMVFSAVGNITVLVLIIKRRRQTPSRITTTLMHLAIADLLVTFLMMPLEIVWAYTVSWNAGDAMCRIMAFFRMFGLCLSSFILVCISLDRYYAILKPLHLTGIDRRGKFMLSAAWIGAAACCMPQALIFQVGKHPNITNYEQCVTYNVLKSHNYQVIYSAFGVVMMYIIPLALIIYCYAAILLEIFRRTRTSVGDRIRRSSLGFLGRAKIRTLKMTIIIVLVFFVCWTPYNVMLALFTQVSDTLTTKFVIFLVAFANMMFVLSQGFFNRYWYDREAANKIDPRIQKGLFLFACTNSCMNPIVYGAFNIRARRAGAQAPELNNSQHHSSTRQGTDVVCLVSWKKTQKAVPAARRRDVCLSCGESFEFATEAPGLCSLNSK